MSMLEDAIREYGTYEDRSTDPATPSAGTGLIYFKDGKIHSRDDAGAVVEYGVGGGGGGGTFVGCLAKRTTSQSVANNTVTPVEFNAADEVDTDDFHDPSSNPSRITIPAGKAGKYRFSAYILYAAHATGARDLGLRKNGTTTIAHNRQTSTGGTLAKHMTISFGPVVLAEGDYLEATAYQDSGGARDLLGATIPLYFSAEFIGT